MMKLDFRKILFYSIPILLFFGALMIPQFGEDSKESLQSAPWKLELAQDLGRRGIKIGPSREDHIRVAPEGDAIRVEVSAAFLKAEPEDFLSKLKMASPTEFMSMERYLEFLGLLKAHHQPLTEPSSEETAASIAIQSAT